MPRKTKEIAENDLNKPSTKKTSMPKATSEQKQYQKIYICPKNNYCKKIYISKRKQVLQKKAITTKKTSAKTATVKKKFNQNCYNKEDFS